MNAPERIPSTKPSFKWDDPLLLDEQLTEEERMVRDTAHAYAQEKLLRAGFLPSLQDNLLEAAVQCLPYLDRDNLEPGPGAAVRLESILAKLAALAPPDENVARAIANYRTRLDEHRRADRRSTTLAFALFALLGVAIVAAIVWLVVRLT